MIGKGASGLEMPKHKQKSTETEMNQASAAPEQVSAEINAEQPVAELVEQINALKQEIDTERSKATEYLDGWQRARAEFANYKKRIEREQSQIYQSTSASIIKRYLDVVDDLERALKNRPQQGDGSLWADGVELIYRKLLSILEAEGITVMKSEGQAFDPNLHEAVTSEENDKYKSGQIIEVLKQGYMFGDKVLRPALVRVAR